MESEIRAREAIRCRECGYRVMYKKRTRRSMYNVLDIVIFNFFELSTAIFSVAASDSE